MGRLTLFALAAVLIYLLCKRIMQYGKNQRSQDLVSPEEMVQCAVCQLYLPRSTASSQGAHFYCESHKPGQTDS